MLCVVLAGRPLAENIDPSVSPDFIVMTLQSSSSGVISVLASSSITSVTSMSALLVSGIDSTISTPGIGSALLTAGIAKV